MGQEVWGRGSGLGCVAGACEVGRGSVGNEVWGRAFSQDAGAWEVYVIGEEYVPRLVAV